MLSPVIMCLCAHVHMPSYVPPSLSLCLHMLDLSAAPPHGGRSGGGGESRGGALQWLHLCLLLGESRHRGCLHSQSWRCRKLPDQWGGSARRWADAQVLHGVFSTDFSMGLLYVGHQSRYLELFSAPPRFVSQAMAAGSLSWAVNDDASSPGSSWE